jgi:hypothetical protein
MDKLITKTYVTGENLYWMSQSKMQSARFVWYHVRCPGHCKLSTVKSGMWVNEILGPVFFVTNLNADMLAYFPQR